MANDLIMDTGALVSLLDRGQRHHQACVSVLSEWTGNIVTTEAVLTESTHLLSRVPRGGLVCLDFISSGGATLVPASRGSLKRCRELMAKYMDLPMDYADASLVALAEELGSNRVFTLDRDFEVYRLPRGRRFRILPNREA